MKLSQLKQVISSDINYGDIDHIIRICGDQECSFFKTFKNPREIRRTYPNIDNLSGVNEGLIIDNSGFLIRVVSNYGENENVANFEYLVYGDE